MTDLSQYLAEMNAAELRLLADAITPEQRAQGEAELARYLADNPAFLDDPEEEDDDDW